MNLNDPDYLFGQAETEEDRPLDPPLNQSREMQDKLEERRLEVAEKDKDRKDKRYFTAFNLIQVCLAILMIIYFVETWMNFKTGAGAEGIADNVIEIIKTLLFTLSGYLFAKKENGD